MSTARIMIDIYYGVLIGFSYETVRFTIKEKKPLVLLGLIVPILGYIFRIPILVTIADLLEAMGFIG